MGIGNNNGDVLPFSCSPAEGIRQSRRVGSIVFSSMDTPTIYQELVKVTPLVVGAVLAILGGVMGQFITHILTTRREKNALFRERAESLVRSLYAHSQWLDDKCNSIFRDEGHDAPSPLAEAQMIQQLYFPELGSVIAAVMQAQIPMMQFVSDQRYKRIKDQNAWAEAWSDAPYGEMYKTHLIVRNAAIAKCRKLLQTQFNI